MSRFPEEACRPHVIRVLIHLVVSRCSEISISRFVHRLSFSYRPIWSVTSHTIPREKNSYKASVLV